MPCCMLQACLSNRQVLPLRLQQIRDHLQVHQNYETDHNVREVVMKFGLANSTTRLIVYLQIRSSDQELGFRIDMLWNVCECRGVIPEAHNLA